ncbi:MAG: GNAT family N-acetyltransferase [Pseudolabrys sp.]|nr:GNAT family N-acetyltransferase [Pseudolabrys sp.]MDP2295873.1 GNAT family N-acetyltransferase [Pseudolabrys sp.]
MVREVQSRRDEQGRADGADKEGSGSEIRLEPIGASNKKAVLALELAQDQQDFLADNASSLKEAASDDDARPRAVVAGNRVVGFLMYDAGEDDGEALIYRFMIDRRNQGRGYGRAALSALLKEIRALGHVRDALVCYMPENEGARRLYQSAGFVDEGADEDGEMIARLRFVRQTRRP